MSVYNSFKNLFFNPKTSEYTESPGLIFVRISIFYELMYTWDGLYIRTTFDVNNIIFIAFVNYTVNRNKSLKKSISCFKKILLILSTKLLVLRKFTCPVGK